eukprot:GHVP01006190.1.p1 GENE.GHVP01006190.1~~GHVP01006190.1.p1  ORF type:complete len:206 (-),score=46.31 GHVP01006190.1:113-730(-)
MVKELCRKCKKKEHITKCHQRVYCEECFLMKVGYLMRKILKESRDEDYPQKGRSIIVCDEERKRVFEGLLEKQFVTMGKKEIVYRKNKEYNDLTMEDEIITLETGEELAVKALECLAEGKENGLQKECRSSYKDESSVTTIRIFRCLLNEELMLLFKIFTGNEMIPQDKKQDFLHKELTEFISELQNEKESTVDSILRTVDKLAH